MTVCRKWITRSVRSPRFARRKNAGERHSVKSVNHVTTAYRRTLFACKIIHIQQGVDNLAADENCVVYCRLRPLPPAVANKSDTHILSFIITFSIFKRFL